MPRPNGTETKNASAPRPVVPTDTRHGLAVVFLFAGALIVGLAFFGLAGVLGEALRRGLTLALGWVAYAVAPVLLAFGYTLLQPNRRFRWSHTIGFLLLASGLAGLVHSGLPEARWWTAVALEQGGGYLGVLTLAPLTYVFGRWGAIVLLTALTASGILVMFETSLHGLLASMRSFLSSIKLPALPLPTLSAKPAPRPPESVQDPTSAPSFFRSRVVSTFASPAPMGKPEQGKLLEVKPAKVRRVAVPLDLLDQRRGTATSGDIGACQEKIRRTLENFGIPVEMGSVNVGPTVTQYTLKPAEGVKLASITALSNDLALALAAHPIRIEAPIPGQSLVGIEVPNQAVATVGLRELLESPEFKARTSNLTVALGKDVAGTTWVADIGRMPHLLVAGSTGSGKSVCINNIILSLLYTNSPDELKFIIVDPKRVELAAYNDLPHLLTPVITEISKTINALKWVVGEMERRYQVLATAGKRNIQAYNQTVEEPIPYLMVVVDEFAGLMVVAAADVETAIIRLAQMSRAVGIHLILATQRPSVNVITGLIKANITSRIAFAVASGTDSRTILDTSGAEKLLGRGDGLYLSAELSKPKRLQGALVTDVEIERVTTYLKAQGRPDYNREVVAKPARNGGQGAGSGDEGDDDLLAEARVVVIRAQKASASFLQRRLRVGYARAARLLDLLEERGVIGPGEGAKPREVMVRREDLGEDWGGFDVAEVDGEAETGEGSAAESGAALPPKDQAA